MKLQVIFYVCILAHISKASPIENDGNTNEALQNDLIENDFTENDRQGKFFFLVKILPEPCRTGDAKTPDGVCMDLKSCSGAGMIRTTRCARGFGTCCLIRGTCGGSSNRNGIYFVNPHFPTANPLGGKCEFTVNRMNNNICQLRFDLLHFNLAQPNAESGICFDDTMSVVGTTSPVPTLCGNNEGQHFYVNVDPQGGPVRIIVDQNTNVILDRIFNIRITQIPCTSKSLAPPGCLQYFAATSGNVQSFNFPQSPEMTLEMRQTRQISDTEYSVCIRPEVGYCNISWSPDPTFNSFSFFVSGNGPSLASEIFGNIQAIENNCPNDYVLIPGGEYINFPGDLTSAERYCGPAFPNPVTSSFQPFNLFVKTDNIEGPVDVGNFGFSLNFRQTIC